MMVPSRTSGETAMPNLTAISRSLAHFVSSDRTFQIIHTFPPSLARLPITTLYILDSSFNPPTRAHMGMCLSALRDEKVKTQDQRRGVKRLLLLLATKNADKAAVPAAFHHRLAMMGSLAEDLRRVVKEAGGGEGKCRDSGNEEALDAGHDGKTECLDLIVDVGVTKEAMFTAKAREIDESGAYTLSDDQNTRRMEQVHLTGFDTLIRLVDAKYYPDQSLASLDYLFEANRVRVTMREPPPKAEQERFVRELEEGRLEKKGWKKAWSEKLEIVEGKDDQISSTKARDSLGDLGSRNYEATAQFGSPGVVEYIMREGLYVKGNAEGTRAG